MNPPLFILFGAMAAGMIIYYAGILLIIFGSIPFCYVFVGIGEKRYLKHQNKKITPKRILIYFIGILLGFVSGIVSVVVLFYLIGQLISLSGFTFD